MTERELILEAARRERLDDVVEAPVRRGSVTVGNTYRSTVNPAITARVLRVYEGVGSKRAYPHWRVEYRVSRDDESVQTATLAAFKSLYQTTSMQEELPA